MPKPRGESHHSATLTLQQASDIKARASKGEPLASISASENIPYQTLYRLAKGRTWANALPRGDVLDGKPSQKGPGRKVGLAAQHKIWQGHRSGIGTSRLASITKLSESTIRRLCTEFEDMLSHRISRLHLTSGNHGLAMKRYGLVMSEAEALDAAASKVDITPKLMAVVERDFPALEKRLNGASK